MPSNDIARRPNSVHRALAAALVVLAIAVAAALPMNEAAAQTDAETQAAVAHAKSLSTAFRAAAKSVIPAVVEVKSNIPPRAVMGNLPFGGPMLNGENEESLPMGSGVILDPKGIVLTNNHVVSGAKALTVELADGRTLDVVDVLIDERSDLAVVRVKTDEPLPFAKLGDSDALDIGDWVLAIGSPFDLDLSVSAGIVSAKGRSLGPTQRSDFIQTDAAINPGNSGGPLINLDGRVVGINTAIASRSGGYQGIGFAIPAKIAEFVVDQLLEFGEVRRAYLGVSIRPINGADATALGVPAHGGVVVLRTFENSPGEKAGLKRNDVLLSFDGKPVHSAADLQAIVEAADIRETHKAQIIRDGQPTSLDVKLETMPADFGKPESLLSSEPEYYRDPQLGMLLIEPNMAMLERFGFDGASGVLVIDATRGAAGHAAGLRSGMLITTIDGRAIDGMEAYEAAMGKASLEKGVAMSVMTPQGKQDIVIQIQ